MTPEQLLKVLNDLNVTPEALTVFLQSGMASLEIDTLKNRIAKLRSEQSGYNTQIEGQVQELQAEINKRMQEIVGAS